MFPPFTALQAGQTHIRIITYLERDLKTDLFTSGYWMMVQILHSLSVLFLFVTLTCFNLNLLKRNTSPNQSPNVKHILAL